MLVLTRNTGQSIIFRPLHPQQASSLTLARVVNDAFITINSSTSRHTRPDLEIRFPDDLLVLETVTEGRDRYFDLLIRETVDPGRITLADVFERGPIEVVLTSRHNRGVRLGIEAPGEISVLRAEIQDRPPRQRRWKKGRQVTPECLIA